MGFVRKFVISETPFRISICLTPYEICRTQVTRKPSLISKDKPDFLNRASIHVLLAEYAKEERKGEAFAILKDFICMKKGIPHKTELIFSSVRGFGLKNDDVWKLISASLECYDGLPVNVFVEQITADLAAQNHSQAIDAIIGWLSNPKYTSYSVRGSFNLRNNIQKLIANPQTFEKGCRAFEGYILSEAFIKETESFDAYKIAELLAEITKTDLEAALQIYNRIFDLPELAINQQIILCASVNDLKSEDKNFPDLYKRFVIAKLRELSSIDKIVQKITEPHAREQFVQAAEKLTKTPNFEDALYILSVFINDPDPSIENKEDDPEGQFNYHKQILEGKDSNSISTVRGFCAWLAQDFINAEGREYIPRVIPYVEKLLTDENYFIT